MRSLDWELIPRKLKIKQEDGLHKIWCIIRSKWMVYTPEELVRQTLIHALEEEMNYNLSNFGVEKEFKLKKMRKRFDIMVNDEFGNPWMLIECKAPNVQLNDKNLQQLLSYNIELKASYLMLCNGLSSSIWDVNRGEWLSHLPLFLI